MIIDHVTYQVPFKVLQDPALTPFMGQLGLDEIDPSGDILEAGWDVRWFAESSVSVQFPFTIHLVGAEEYVRLGLGHFCVMGLGPVRFAALRKSHWVDHDSFKDIDDPRCRCWLNGPGGLRVEVRP